MKRGLIRFEDVGPGGEYGTEEKLEKLKEVGRYLKSQDIPFHIAMVSRYIDPRIDYDKSISDISDPFVNCFIKTMKYLHEECGASIGMHGYTHQDCYAPADSLEAVSIVGCEFNIDYDDPDTPFENTYAFSRIQGAIEALEKSGVQIDWFETPHYDSTENNRKIIEECFGVVYEGFAKQAQLLDGVSNGVIYVPTPLDYILEEDPDGSITSMFEKVDNGSEEDLASFFYDPCFEFNSIHVENTEKGFAATFYDDNSYLKRIVNEFKQRDYSFVSALKLMNFIPSIRQTDFFAGDEYKFFTGDMNGDGISEVIVWDSASGDWYSASLTGIKPPYRYKGGFEHALCLSGWIQGEEWTPLIEDIDGDGKADVAAYNSATGEWRIALSDGTAFIPNQGVNDDYVWLKDWIQGEVWTPLSGDFNGDGKGDLAAYNSETGEWKLALSTGTSFLISTDSEDYAGLKDWIEGSDWTLLTGDFNNDGRVDIAAYSKSSGECRIALSGGTIFMPEPALDGGYAWIKNWVAGDEWTLLTGDFDGSGFIDDLLAVNPSDGTWQVAVNSGNSFMLLNDSFAPWSAGEDMQPLAGRFVETGSYSICARHPDGTIDVAYMGDK